MKFLRVIRTLLLLSLVFNVFVISGLFFKLTFGLIWLAAVMDIILSIFYLDKYSVKYKNWILFVFLFVFSSWIYLSYIEKTNYSNFVFSSYHISIDSLLCLTFWLGLNTFMSYLDDLYKIVIKVKIRLPKLSVLFILLFSICYTYIVAGANLKSSWSPVDDHEIVYFLGPHHKLDSNQFFSKLAETEVYKWGVSTRFRPVYYIFRLGETLLWGDNVSTWYGFRLFILFLFISVFLYILTFYFNSLLSVLVILAIMSQSYWSDIFARMGPAEIYGVLGLTVFIFGVFLYLKKNSSDISSLFVLVGGIISIGSKENFMLLVAPVLYLLFICFKRRSWLLFVSLLILLVFSIFVCAGLFLAINLSKADIYGRVINVNYLFLFIFLFFLVFYLSRNYLKFFLSSVNNEAIFPLIIVLMVSSQKLFYGDWPTNIRYDFPGVLCLNILFLLVYKKLLIVLGKSKNKKLLEISSLFPIVLTLLLILYTINNGMSPLYFASVKNQKISNCFTTEMLKIGKFNNLPVIIKSDNTIDYELILSVQRFINYYNSGVNIFLSYDNTQVNMSKFEYSLDKIIRSASVSGLWEGKKIFVPIANTPLKGDMIYISFPKHNPNFVCGVNISLLNK